jgi:hypothetical protein
MTGIYIQEKEVEEVFVEFAIKALNHFLDEDRAKDISLFEVNEFVDDWLKKYFKTPVE